MEIHLALWYGVNLALLLSVITVVLGIAFPHIRRLLVRLRGRRDVRTLSRSGLLTARRVFAVRGGYLPSLLCRPPPVR
jgi:hypothetical protein